MSGLASPDPQNNGLDDQVEQALYRRAMGMVVETKEIVVEGDKKRLKQIRRELPPDVAATKFVLTNRRPEAWRSKPPPPEPQEKIIRIHPIVRERPADELERD